MFSIFLYGDKLKLAPIQGSVQILFGQDKRWRKGPVEYITLRLRVLVDGMHWTGHSSTQGEIFQKKLLQDQEDQEGQDHQEHQEHLKHQEHQENQNHQEHKEHNKHQDHQDQTSSTECDISVSVLVSENLISEKKFRYRKI